MKLGTFQEIRLFPQKAQSSNILPQIDNITGYSLDRTLSKLSNKIKHWPLLNL